MALLDVERMESCNWPAMRSTKSPLGNYPASSEMPASLNMQLYPYSDVPAHTSWLAGL